MVEGNIFWVTTSKKQNELILLYIYIGNKITQIVISLMFQTACMRSESEFSKYTKTERGVDRCVSLTAFTLCSKTLLSGLNDLPAFIFCEYPLNSIRYTSDILSMADYKSFQTEVTKESVKNGLLTVRG